MLPLTKILLLLTFSAALVHAETPAASPTYWHLVNTAVVLRVDPAGKLTFLNTGEAGHLTLAADRTFSGTFAETPFSGKFADGKLWLRRTSEPTPAALAFLEARPIDQSTAHELLRFSRSAHRASSADLPRALRNSIANALQRRLATLAEAVMFHCLENAVEKVDRLDDLIGPDKQLSALPSIDGEDYSKLDLRPEATWTIESASGIKVTYGPSPE